MPMIKTDDGWEIYVEVSGDESKPALMLSNSLGTNLHMWHDQAGEFDRHFYLVRYDRRGHGLSGAPQGPYSFGRLGRDILTILDALKIAKVSWCGLSMGGMESQWLGANAPERVEKLVLANTHFYTSEKKPWADRIKVAAESGLDALVDAAIQRWFTEEFRKAQPQKVARMKEMFVATKMSGYVGCCEAIMEMDFRASNPTIKSPTLVIVGEYDAATPPSAGQAIAQQITSAWLATVQAAHISNIEQSGAFTRAVLEFLQ